MSDPAGWENDPGKKFMMKLVANPLASSGGYHLAGGAPAVDKGKKREDESSSFQATVSFPLDPVRRCGADSFEGSFN